MPGPRGNVILSGEERLGRFGRVAVDRNWGWHGGENQLEAVVA